MVNGVFARGIKIYISLDPDRKKRQFDSIESRHVS